MRFKVFCSVGRVIGIILPALLLEPVFAGEGHRNEQEKVSVEGYVHV
ncbi:MAG: hypothetical protein ACUVUR_04420 [bacterium]